LEDTLAMAEIHNGDQESNYFGITNLWCDVVIDMDYGNDHNGDLQSNSFAGMRITDPWCDAVINMDYGNDHTLDDLSRNWERIIM